MDEDGVSKKNLTDLDNPQWLGLREVVVRAQGLRVHGSNFWVWGFRVIRLCLALVLGGWKFRVLSVACSAAARELAASDAENARTFGSSILRGYSI